MLSRDLDVHQAMDLFDLGRELRDARLRLREHVSRAVLPGDDVAVERRERTFPGDEDAIDRYAEGLE